MATAGEVITHAVTGSQVIFVKTARETNGEYIEVEQIVKPGSDLLPAHIHAIQTETFRVLSGKAKYELNGQPRILEAGEEVSFAPGTSHINPMPEGGADLHMRVTVTPALDFHILLETIIKAAEKGDANPDGSVKKLHSIVLLHGVQSKVYLAGQPIWLQKMIFPVLAFIGRLAGYKASYSESQSS